MDILDYIISITILAFVSASLTKLEHHALKGFQINHQLLAKHQQQTEFNITELGSLSCTHSIIFDGLLPLTCSSSTKTHYALAIP